MTDSPSGSLARAAESNRQGTGVSRRAEIGIGLGLLWIGLATYLQVARQPGVPAFDSLWAEDGSVFLSDALRESGPLALFHPLAGYLHLLPRLLAEIAAALPLRYAGWILSVGAAAIVSLLSLYVFHASRSLIGSVWFRAALATLIVAMPAASTESLNNAASLHFFVIFPCFWALLDRPRSRGGTLAACLVALAATLIDPRTAFLLPVAIWRALRDRDGPGRMIVAVFLAGLLVQGAVVAGAIFFHTDPTVAQYPINLDETYVLDLPGLFGLRVVGPLIVGERYLDNAWTMGGWGFAYAGLLLAFGAFGFGFRRAVGSIRPWIVITFLYSLVYFMIPAAAWGTRDLWPFEAFYLAGNRYTLYPILFLLTMVFTIVAPRSQLSTDERSPPTRAQVAVLLFVGVIALANMALPNVRAAGPRWTQALADAERACARGDRPAVTIPVAPASDPPAWFVTAPCQRLG